MMKKVPIAHFSVGEGEPLLIIAGPCVIESESLTLSIAENLSRLFRGRSSNLIFKASYDKANRLSASSFRGLGMQEGLRILEKVQSEIGLPVVTDVHTPEEAAAAGQICDVLQIPAFLCRQTDLLVAAAKTGAALNVKKGQFLAPEDMQYVVEKITQTGNERILLVDRGTMFGYHNLVNDFRAIPLMQGLGFPVIFDATHSVQRPGGNGKTSGGDRQYILPLAKAASVLANGLFLEVHPSPSEAKSDPATVYPLDQFPALVEIVERLYACAHEQAFTHV